LLCLLPSLSSLRLLTQTDNNIYKI
jgi:hypothetical protein